MAARGEPDVPFAASVAGSDVTTSCSVAEAPLRASPASGEDEVRVIVRRVDAADDKRRGPPGEERAERGGRNKGHEAAIAALSMLALNRRLVHGAL